MILSEIIPGVPNYFTIPILIVSWFVMMNFFAGLWPGRPPGPPRA